MYCYRYAANRVEELRSKGLLRPRSHIAKWEPVTATEMEGFLAIIVNMGLISMPQIQDYWSTSWTCQLPFFNRTMTRDRFMNIFWLLHVSCEQDGVTPRRIDKVRALLDLLIPKFQASYYPSRDISVDETMVGFRGRFGPKQYIPSKPQKYGIKAFTMADSDHGYLLNILVYTGADKLLHADSQYQQHPQPCRVVLDLVKPYLDKGHHVFTDRYYTSVPLAQALEAKSTAFTGTAVRNRSSLPDPIRKQSRLADNEVKAFRANRLIALEWRAPKKKKGLVMLSSQSSAAMTAVRTRWNQEEVEKPVVVDRYNHSMNGVDRADQNSVYYPFIRKTRKWWRKLFFWLFEVTVVNSYILYHIHTTQLQARPLTHLQFRRRLVDALAARHIQAAPPRRRPGRPRRQQLPSSSEDSQRLNGRLHILEKRIRAQDCTVCSSRDTKRHRTHFFCKTCSNNPTLCPTPCFELYHTREVFR